MRRIIPAAALLVGFSTACSSSNENEEGLHDPTDAGADAVSETASDAASDTLADWVTEPSEDATDDGAAEGEAAAPETWTLGVVDVTEYPSANWDVDEQEGQLVATHDDGRVVLVIDVTASDDDGRYAGVFVEVDGVGRHAGRYYGSEVSMFVPDRAFVDQETVSIVAQGDALEVEMLEGSLSEMSDAQFPSTEPFRWASRWSVSSMGLTVEGNGLYYVLPPMDGCLVETFDEVGALLGSNTIEADTAPFLTYYEQVRTIALASPSLGSMTIETDTAVLQVQVPSYPDTSRFELDFDHAFKDHGQQNVMTRMLLSL